MHQTRFFVRSVILMKDAVACCAIQVLDRLFQVKLAFLAIPPLHCGIKVLELGLSASLARLDARATFFGLLHSLGLLLDIRQKLSSFV